MLRAGTLNRRIRIEQAGTARSPSGQPIVAPWTLFANPWANIRYLNGKQYVTADRETAAASVSIRIRYRTDITADMRIVYLDQVFEILAVLPDEDHREHCDLVCSVGVRL